MPLADVRRLVEGFVRDESERLTRPDKDAALASALSRYGDDVPREVVEAVLTPGGDRLPLPAGWQTTSTVVDVEYPVEQSPRALLPCSLYTTPSGKLMRLGAALPEGEEAWVTFTVAHLLTDTEDTVLPHHREAVAAYAAALLLEELAAAAINDGDSTLTADTVDRRSKAAEYASRARALKLRYREGIGDGEDAEATGTTVSWPGRGRFPGRAW